MHFHIAKNASRELHRLRSCFEGNDPGSLTETDTRSKP